MEGRRTLNLLIDLSNTSAKLTSKPSTASISTLSTETCSIICSREKSFLRELLGTLRSDNRELKQRKFSGRRRLEWQREAGTDVAVASRQIQLFKRQVHSDGDGVAFQRKK